MLRQSALLMALVTAVACGETVPRGAGARPDLGFFDFGFADEPVSPGPDGGASEDADMGVGASDGGPAFPDPFNDDNDLRDFDCDGLSDQEEFARIFPDGQQTDPANPDTDGDGIPDGTELGRQAPIPGSGCVSVPADDDPSTTTVPTQADTDGDGIDDGAEDGNGNGARESGELDPRLDDTDGDGLLDGIEDRNRNGRRDSGELDGTSPDSDGDGLSDGVEDRSRDGIFDEGETDPLDRDTDGDGLLDGDEDANFNGIREPFETDPTRIDTDCDGLSDGEELALGTSPLVPDTDGDLLPDGLELGRGGALDDGQCPPGGPEDLDPTTTTVGVASDTDGDGLADGAEDANRNGRVDPGESDPNLADTDGDGLNDGDETLAGFDPSNPDEPRAGRIPGILQICADENLAAIAFEEDRHWTLALPPGFGLVPATSSDPDVRVAAFDDLTAEISGFALRLPLLPEAAASASAQSLAIDARANVALADAGLARSPRLSGRNIRSHDGFETVVSGVYDVASAGPRVSPGEVRNLLVRGLTGLGEAELTGLPPPTGTNATEYVHLQQVLVRPDEILVLGAFLDRTAFDDRTDNRAIVLQDLVNGTSLAETGASSGKECDPFLAEDRSVADFLWMADISGSTNEDREQIVSAASVIVDALDQNDVDFRMGVVPHVSNEIQFPGNGGDLRGAGFTTDPDLFVQYLRDVSGTDGCEFGLEAARNAIDEALPRSLPGEVDPLKLRADAVLAVIYVSDEFAEELTSDGGRCNGYEPVCETGIRDTFNTDDGAVCLVEPDSSQQECIDSIVEPYIDQIVANNGIAFAQVIPPQSPPVDCEAYACAANRNEPGRGYLEVVQATGGAQYTPCSRDPGDALSSIIDAVSGAASQYTLTGNPISSTIKVGVIRLSVGSTETVLVPRDRDNGFDYDAASNSIFFRGFDFRPQPNDVVVISYRLWEPPQSRCGDCPVNKRCDEDLGVCVCDPVICEICEANGQACDANCNCACADCNGICGPGEVCNPTTCECECAANCGGACSVGSLCDAQSDSCSCLCEDCGGACGSSLAECDGSTCTCECPSDCGGLCDGNTECNASLCACVCEAGCDDACSGNAVCDPGADCACACPENCGCVEGAVCNEAACTCECPAECTAACSGNEVCDPSRGCECACPDDCGGCGPSETCDLNACRCVPIV
ncbi:MAG: hypothetical protein ACFB9M_18550 [Myxococcota bacterium]